MRFFLLVPLLLAACQTEADTGAERVIRPETYDKGIVLGAGCSETKFGPKALIGRRADSIPFGDFGFPVRVVRPGMAVTMDYSAARLTVSVGADGVIDSYNCG